jgi:cobalt-zinc-cadmium efflux system membrane fusion protein
MTALLRHMRAWCCATVFAVSGCAQEAETVPYAESPSPPEEVVEVGERAYQEMQVDAIEPGPLTQELVIQGRVQASLDALVRVSSPLDGIARDVRTRLGENVTSGHVLVMLESAEISTAYADLVKAESDLRLATRAFRASSDLYRAKAMPKREFELAENELVKAQAEYRRSREHLLALKVPEAELDKPSEQRKITARFEVRAPITGTVVEKTIVVGQIVEKNVPLFTIADLDTVLAVGEIYERDLRFVRPGMPAHVTVDAAPGIAFPATVQYVGDIVDPKMRTVKIRCEVKNLEHQLKPEMFARTSIGIGEEMSALVLPREAVIHLGDRDYAFVETGRAHFERRHIITGRITGDRVEIHEGVQPGERVVVKGALLLQGALEKGKG